jgi:hypothetical protein
LSSVLEKEKRTIEKMVKLYCWKKHGVKKGELCNQCRELLNYAFARLDNCPFGENKPTCKKCPVHCYSPSMRVKIKEVMRFSGPRLLIYDPLGWLLHELRERLKRPTPLRR